MFGLRVVIAVGGLLGALVVSRQGVSAATATAAAATDRSAIRFESEVTPILNEYCFTCHGNGKARGGVALDRYKDGAAAAHDLGIWQKVWNQLRNNTMPPKSKPQPTLEQRALVVHWIEGDLLRVDCDNPDPGRVTLRRLNRIEYRNTIRDLLGVKFDPEEDFPADDVGYGFDNIGDVLSLSPLLLEKYLLAADKILELVFPGGDKPPTPAQRKLFVSQPTPETEHDCAREVLSAFVRRAYRRPVSAREIDRLSAFFEMAIRGGESFDGALKVALKAVIVSPHFLYREEPQSESDNPGASRPIDEHALASRLAYFLWSTMPDEELMAEADQGHLRANLDGQVGRMLKDAKAKALTENFAGQWLQLRNLKSVAPDAQTYPEFDVSLRVAMERETELCFEYVAKEDRSVEEFIEADYTFLNERLARHYGIKGIAGEEFRRVELTNGHRGGLLTQASILTLTSNPTRTSPVKRGKWVLENLLGTPPPPPPPDVPELSDAKEAVLSGTLRQRMEQHRANPLCASCHAAMDPIGFALENYDGIGTWRTSDGVHPIDPSGTLPSGAHFAGAVELKSILLAQKEQFIRCLSEKMLTYAIGRGMEYYDQCALDEITRTVLLEKGKFSNLILAVVHSAPFQRQRGEGQLASR